MESAVGCLDRTGSRHTLQHSTNGEQSILTGWVISHVHCSAKCQSMANLK